MTYSAPLYSLIGSLLIIKFCEGYDVQGIQDNIARHVIARISNLNQPLYLSYERSMIYAPGGEKEEGAKMVTVKEYEKVAPLFPQEIESHHENLSEEVEFTTKNAAYSIYELIRTKNWDSHSSSRRGDHETGGDDYGDINSISLGGGEHLNETNDKEFPKISGCGQNASNVDNKRILSVLGGDASGSSGSEEDDSHIDESESYEVYDSKSSEASDEDSTETDSDYSFFSTANKKPEEEEREELRRTKIPHGTFATSDVATSSENMYKSVGETHKSGTSKITEVPPPTTTTTTTTTTTKDSGTYKVLLSNFTDLTDGLEGIRESSLHSLKAKDCFILHFLTKSSPEEKRGFNCTIAEISDGIPRFPITSHMPLYNAYLSEKEATMYKDVEYTPSGPHPPATEFQRGTRTKVTASELKAGVAGNTSGQNTLHENLVHYKNSTEFRRHEVKKVKPVERENFDYIGTKSYSAEKPIEGKIYDPIFKARISRINGTALTEGTGHEGNAYALFMSKNAGTTSGTVTQHNSTQLNATDMAVAENAEVATGYVPELITLHGKSHGNDAVQYNQPNVMIDVR